ncbi:TerD family protein [Candidatus Nitrosacidococcus sp. I8]|uniref:TerD family protein n=1 Tax=Candidatus Nitrosacidococcus sp. I8 TaxID=2942908 RepID=UPI002225B93D|nr:TerD family protein [Candidatus Nitrosacidococcus sp. I8]CAH9018425.1 General stress protein 16U [Candidatus Nitrosacidococcus sp. I8]
MALTLQKGGNLSLSKTDPSLTKIIIGLGWDPRATDGAEFDLDASVFLLGSNDKVRSDGDFIFYNQLKSPDGAVEHTGDNRTGAGDGDDEVIKVDLTLIPSDVEKVAFAATIHEADARKQNFGQVGNSFIRLVNETTGTEVVRYDLSEDASTETAMIFAEIYRHNDEWKFRAIGQGYVGGLRALANNYGINI